MIVTALLPKLPMRYFAEPRARLGRDYEIDVASYDLETGAETVLETHTEQGGVATAIWAPPRPTLSVISHFPDQHAYEVRVYDGKRRRRLVAAVEIVSPANKDRPARRRQFVAKCAELLRRHVCVAIVDLVTTRQVNLYSDLLELAGHADAAISAAPPAIYAAVCRWRREEEATLFETWVRPFAIGQPLPTMPLWLSDDFALPLELEPSYEETCRVLRIE